MALGIRKLVVLVLVAAVFLLANWLEKMGAVDSARHLRREYLTGPAITIIVVLLILLVRPGPEAASKARGLSA